MGMMDNMKDKAKDAVREHGDKITQGLDKAKEKVKEKTGGQHDDKIDRGAERAQQAIEDFGR
jgi:MT0933-like antitoxin protein